MTEEDDLTAFNECIQLLTRAFDSADLNSLGEITGLVFARHLDYKTYSQGNKDAKLLHDAPKTAAYVLLNQLIFYSTLIRENPQFDSFPPLTGLSFQLLKEIFATASRNGFDSIFRPNLFEFLPESEEFSADINIIIERISQFDINHGNLSGNYFARLIPLEIRKHIAAFYTGNVGAKLLADLSIDAEGAKILDLTCGSGTLLVHGYRRKMQLKNLAQVNSTIDPAESHAAILRDIFGNDAVPFATQLAAMNLLLEGPLASPGILNISSGDGFHLHPNGSDTTKGEEVQIPPVDVVLMNPPFTRHERVSKEFSSKIQEILEQEGYGEFIAGKMSLQHFFLFHADAFLKLGGNLAFVVPANTFNVDLSERLIAFLIDKKYHLKYLIANNSGAGAFSEECSYKEYLFIAQKGGLTEDSQTKCLLFSELPAIESLDACIEFIRNVESNGTTELGGLKLGAKLVNTLQLYHSDKWDPTFWDLQDEQILEILRTDSHLVPLANSGEFTFMTGFHSTHCDSLIIPNHLFKISQEFGERGLEVERIADGVKITIPRYFLRPCLREPKIYQHLYVNPQHWVLSINRNDILPEDFADLFLKYTQDLLACQVRKKFNKGGKVRENLDQFWYTHPHETGCDSKTGHLWTFNRYGLWRRGNAAFYTEQEVTANDGFHLYHYHGNDLPEEEALQILNSWFNSSIHLFDFLRKCRVPATHVQQTLKPDREQMFVPVISSLTEVERTAILRATQEFWENSDGTILEQLNQNPRRDLDKAWLKCLHAEDSQIDGLLDRLYNKLTHVINLR